MNFNSRQSDCILRRTMTKKYVFGQKYAAVFLWDILVRVICFLYRMYIFFVVPLLILMMFNPLRGLSDFMPSIE